MSRIAAALLIAVSAAALAGCNQCWVKIYDEENFTWGDNREVLEGPARFAYLNHIPGAWEDTWDNDIESIKTGPKAKVILFAEPNFQGPSIDFGPNAMIPDLDMYDFGDRASSMIIQRVP
jgi:hypothetical protein